MDIKTYTQKHKDDIYLFNQGTFYKAYEMLGAHPAAGDYTDVVYDRGKMIFRY